MADEREGGRDSARERRTELVATPVARDRAIERLQDHYARNHVDVDEFERLVEMAERARTDDELVRLFDGLPALEEPTTAPLTPGKRTATISATLGATSRRGRWRVPAHVVVRARFGSVELDLCDADIDRAETTIEVSALFGSIEIWVPDGLHVECEGSAVLGSFDHIAQDAASKRDRRVVRIVGKATLGSVEIKVRKRQRMLDSLKSAARALLGP